MLRVDASKLKWMGVDMRARWRRRLAVGLTYAVYAVVVWVHPQRTFSVLYLIYLAGVGQGVASAIAEGMHVWPKRAALGVLMVGLVWLWWDHPHPPDPMADDMWAVVMIVGWSVLGWGKLVDNVWGRGWFARRFSGKAKRLERLDDFARHYFGENFAELPEAQQVEVGRLHRASPMGDWVKPGSGRFPTVEDERLQHENDRLQARVLQWMKWILGVSAVVWSVAEMLQIPVSVGTMAAWAWTVAALALTLRQAIVLWMEEDPTAMSAEMKLVGEEA
jgi:hypothetical protein